MFRDVRECLDAGNRLHTLLASQKPARKSIPILIDVEQEICNESLGITQSSSILFLFIHFFFKNTIKNLKLHLVKYYQKSNSKQMFKLSELQ